MIKEIALSRDGNTGFGFHPFPVWEERARWNALPEATRAFYTGEGKKLKNREWESLPASLYLDFYRNGDRSRYEARYFKRRRDLFQLLMAECIGGAGEYLDDIINGVWLICEETSWVVPAHNNSHPASGNSFYRKRQNADREGMEARPKELADIEDGVYIDLFAAETGSLLAWVYYFLGEPIAARAPLVKRRIELETERRVLVPFLEHDDFAWMGLNHDKPVNNWNPWINSNLLTVCLVFAPTFPRAAEGVNKLIRSVNRFLHFYAEDGGCDEGPGYFDVAGASLLDFIEELGTLSDLSGLYREPKIRNMASYIYKVYIGKDYYVNYADADPSLSVALGLLERTGKKMGDPVLPGFTAYLRKNGFCAPGTVPNHIAASLFRLLSEVFMENSGAEAPFPAPETAWFPGIQVMTARDREGCLGGFFFSAKGGHNDESHNHNDIGSFLLYYDGTPVLVDAGREQYTKFTFSEKRYTIWTMLSCYHNTPTINGVDQAPGAAYRAGGVSFTHREGITRFSLDLAGAYPAEAGVQSYRRDFLFTHGEGLTVTDRYVLSEWKAPLILNLLCYERPEISGSRALLSGRVFMGAGEFNPALEEIPLTDQKIRDNWKKDALYRLRLAVPGREIRGELILRFRPK
jgi:hypothetical protein